MEDKGKAPKWIWIAAPGLLGFLAGFIGPIVGSPDANQGPLVGIFISGPGGVVLGAAGLAAAAALGVSARRQWQLLCGLCAVLTVGTLFAVLPEPTRRGLVLELEVKSCSAPAALNESILNHWRKSITRVTWASPRAGWEAEMTEALKTDQGSVAEAKVQAQTEVRMHRKPWNSGTVFSMAREAVDRTDKFYFTDSCANHPVGEKAKYFQAYGDSPKAPEDWPPKRVPDFIPFAALQAVPAW